MENAHLAAQTMNRQAVGQGFPEAKTGARLARSLRLRNHAMINAPTQKAAVDSQRESLLLREEAQRLRQEMQEAIRRSRDMRADVRSSIESATHLNERKE